MIRRFRVTSFSARPACLILALVAMVVMPSCGQAPLTAPVGSTIAINVNPPFISANGDTAVVSVVVIEPAGTPVPDGTVVQFLTSIGKIQEQGKTNDGVARVNFISDTRSGTAKITVFSGAATTTADVVVGAARPSRMIVGPINRIDLSDGQSTSRVSVTVQDANGNVVPGVQVRFSIVSDPTTDRIIDSADAFTDNSGNASTRVQTQRTVPGTIRVHAEAISATAVSIDFDVPVVE